MPDPKNPLSTDPQPAHDADASQSYGEASFAAAPPIEPKPGQPLWVWAGLGALVLVALFVIFVLPGIVQDYELPLERRVEVTAPTSPSAAPADTGISPFLEAQRARQRKEAQDVLAELLELQSELVLLEVESWAEALYAQALATAADADESYRAQDFEAARDAYASSVATLEQIKASRAEVLAQRLIAGEQALIAQDSAAAIAAFELGLILEEALAAEQALLAQAGAQIGGQNGAQTGGQTAEPDQGASQSAPGAAQIGLRRARAADELAGLLDEAARAGGDPQRQIDILERAVDLDPYSEEAQELLAQARDALQEQRFARAMSDGYARLQAGSPDEAIARFEAAERLGVNSVEARAAIEQTLTELANARIAALQDAAKRAEAAEDWQAAVDEYEAVVAIDATLPTINAALDYAQKRARLDALLIAALDAPERFAEQAVFDETRDVYFTGRAIEDPGPRLVGQLDELQTLLEASQIPLSIRFISDGLTDVTVLRVGELGTFEATRLDLKPGRYAAVGRRDGFREVREEFTVGFGLTPAVVIVRCDEPVSAALGR